MKWCILFVMVVALNANPVHVELINEFQVAPYDLERVELRYLEGSPWDTVFGGVNISLENTPVSTPAGVAYVDTNIAIVGNAEVSIDRSVLTGDFWLPDDSGFVSFDDLYHSIYYPAPTANWQHAPTPPPYYSTAKFHCYVLNGQYHLMTDWYIDPTPTPGAPNDDYPGCIVSGFVFDNLDEPLPGALVTATITNLASATFPEMPVYAHRIAYTDMDGSYILDSLLPSYYDICVASNGHLPDTQNVGSLRCLEPVTGINFYLTVGIAENNEHEAAMGSFVQPNPFRSAMHITMHDPIKRIEIYDVTGKLMRRVDNEGMDNHLSVDCQDLPRGVYFVALREQKLKVIKF